MKRIVRMYKYTCDDCGWEAYRGEIIPADLCSKCGSTKPPTVFTEDREFEVDADVQKAVEYVKRLVAGADPEELDKELSTAGHEKMFRSMGRIIAGFNEYTWSESGADVNAKDPVRRKIIFGDPVVY